MSVILNIVNPCYNPKQGWEKNLLENYKSLILQLPAEVKVHLFLVNDGSCEGISNQSIIYLDEQLHHFTYIHHSENSGKGFAIRSAMQRIKEGYVMYTDIDYPFKTESMVEIFHLLHSSKYDVVLGVRTREYFRKLPLTRKIFSFLLRTANHLFFPGLLVKDTQSGLKACNQKGRAAFLNTRINGFLFEPEFIRLCTRENLRIKGIALKAKDNIYFSFLDWKVLRKELCNYIRLMV
ncbi:MAG: glycosyltransferase family 2 protein [Sphingobacteriaceae bacterium]|nr:glycosyltransferase family 2 protein [Sphingobacteriaceae bacterium]